MAMTTNNTPVEATSSPTVQVATPTTASKTPKDFSLEKLEVKSKQTDYTITLVATKTTRGTDKWTYPALGAIIDNGENQTIEKQYNEIASFRSERALQLMIIEQFDRECQGIWRTSGQDPEKFSLSISDETSGRSPRKMSAYYDKQIRELAKLVKDKQAGKWTPEQANKKKELLLAYKEAVMSELDSQLTELDSPVES